VRGEEVEVALGAEHDRGVDLKNGAERIVAGLDEAIWTI